MKSNLKNKLKKLAKSEMKRRNLIPKRSIISGEEMIKTFKNRNEMPYLPETFPALDTKERQEGAQAYYFVHGSQLNVKTSSHLREVLQKREGKRVVIGGVVSGYSKNGLRILIEFPRTLHIVGTIDTDCEIIDSHLWLDLKECKVVMDDKPRTISLGDYLIIEGMPQKYTSKGQKRYSLGFWGIVHSGLLTSRQDEPLIVKEDYLRVGWIFKAIILDYETNQGQAQIQAVSQIKKDEQHLITIFKEKITYQLKGTDHLKSTK